MAPVYWPIAASIRWKLKKELPEKRASLRTLIARTRNSWHKRKGEYETFPHEVKEAMSAVWRVKPVRPEKSD